MRFWWALGATAALALAGLAFLCRSRPAPPTAADPAAQRVAEAFIARLTTRSSYFAWEAHLSSASTASMTGEQRGAAYESLADRLTVPQVATDVVADSPSTAAATVRPSTPTLRLCLVREKREWRVDLPRTLEGLGEPGPAFETCRARWQSQGCQRALGQLSCALLMYVADYGECFPMADCWSGSLLPYMPGAHALDCPRSTYGYGFAYNRDLNALGVDDARGLNGHLWGDLRAPGELVALYDSSLHGPNRSGLGEDLPDPPRHPDGNHFAFADGHAGASRGEPRFQVEWKPNPPAAPNAR